jgi:pimeloyl-ACP methyl ester carboxylesterase
LFTLAYAVWELNPSPGIPFKLFGYYGGFYLHKEWLKRINNTNQQDMKAFSRIICQTGPRHTSSDRCVSVIFYVGGIAREPLDNLFKNPDSPLRNIDMLFLYGETDSFDRKPADLLKAAGHLSKKSKVETISKCGHHLYICNSKETID